MVYSDNNMSFSFLCHCFYSCHIALTHVARCSVCALWSNAQTLVVAVYAPSMFAHVLWYLLLQHYHLLLEHGHSFIYSVLKPCTMSVCQENYTILSFVIVVKRTDCRAKIYQFESQIIDYGILDITICIPDLWFL